MTRPAPAPAVGAAMFAAAVFAAATAAMSILVPR